MTPLELRWSIRASFFAYVAGLRDGRASVSEGAVLTEDDPQLVLYPAAGDGLAFTGDLRLGGHGGLLFVRLAHPRLEPGDEGWTLSVDDPLTEDGSGPRLPLVTLELSEHDGGWRGTGVRLTPEGVPLFNHVYQAGDAFDDLEVVAAAR